MKRSLHVLVLLIGIIGFTANSSADAGKGYFFNCPGKTVTWRIMFPCPNAKKVFLYTPTAVDILSVVCDGKPIIPELLPVVERPNPATGNADGQTVVYQTTSGFFFACWNDLQDKPAHPKLRHFRIPKDAKLITVKYRIRFPDGSNSEELSVCFGATEEEEDLLMLPNSDYPYKEPTGQP
jgi:hypothetical protein